jgi:hypothetical protein
MVGVEVPEVVAPKRLGQRFERLGGAEPGEAVAQVRRRRPEFRRMGAPHQRVHAVRAYDQIGVGDLAEVGHRAPVARRDAHRSGPRLENLQELQPADGREADAVDADAFAAMNEGDIGPGLNMRHDRREGFRIVLVKELERASGEHDAEAEGGVGTVLLEHPHVGAEIAALDEIGEIEPGGPGAQDRDTHAVRNLVRHG